jgi:hypothetical protein
MSGSLTETDGVILYETHEGKGTGSAYSGGMAYGGTGLTAEYVNLSRDGTSDNIAVKVTSNNMGYFKGTNYKGSQLMSGMWLYKYGTTAENTKLIIPSFNYADGVFNSIVLGYTGSSLQQTAWFGNSSTSKVQGDEILRGAWYYTLSSVGIFGNRNSEFNIFTETNKTIPFCGMSSIGSIGTTIIKNTYCAIKDVSSQGEGIFDENAFMKGAYGYGVNVAGLVSGMSVTVEDVSGNIKGMARATGTSATVAIGEMIMPLIGKFKIYGTDGLLQYESPVSINIFYGTTWTYSGDTKTLVPTKVSTIVFENGSSGTHGYVKFTPTGALGYDVYRASSPFNTFEKIGNSTGTYIDNAVNNQTEYQYYVIGTNTAGASLPSDIVYGFVYEQQFDYLTNVLETLQTQIKAQCTFLNDVRLGNFDALPEQLPLCEIIPDVDDEESVTVGFSGQYDKIYTINIRIYGNGSGQLNETTIKELTTMTGKVQSLLEGLKDYAPYWYLSDILNTTYGECTKDGQVLKYTEIIWQCKRRVDRH